MMPRTVEPPNRPPTQSEIDYGCAVEIYRQRKSTSLAAAVLLVLLLAAAVLPFMWWSR